MILSSGEIGGSGSFLLVAFALDHFHRRHLRQRDVAAGGNRAERVFHAADFRFPDGFAEPDGEALDFQPAPARREEMAKFVDKDEQVEEQQHFENDKNNFHNMHNRHSRAKSEREYNRK